MKRTNLFQFFMLLLFVFVSIASLAQSGQYAIGDSRNQTATNIKVLPDGSGTVIGGYEYDIKTLPGGATEIINAQMILLKVNPSGTAILWQQRFGIASTNNLMQNMIITHDGNIVVVGTMGRNSVYGANRAAILKFNSSTGALMWQNILRDNSVTVGGEIFNGVTELGSASGFDLVAVGARDSRPGASSAMICLFHSNGAFVYEEEWDVPNSDGYYSACTAANGTDVYLCGTYVNNFTDVRVDHYHPYATAFSGAMIWSRHFNYVLPGVVVGNGTVTPGTLTLQNNFFVNIYLAGSKLLIHGGSLNNYTFTGGAGESICRMNADGTGTAELWQIQNNNLNYCNTSKIAVVDQDHVFNVQMPHTSWVDPIIWLAGTNVDAVVTEVTSLTGTGPAINSHSYIKTPMKFTTPTGGIHAPFDIDLYAGNSRLAFAGATNDLGGNGNNDFYMVMSPTTASTSTVTPSVPKDECNEEQIGGCLQVDITPQATLYTWHSFVPEFETVFPEEPRYTIKKLCASQVRCYESGNIAVTSSMTPAGCVFTVTASVVTTGTILGYEWTLPSGAVVQVTSSASSNTQVVTVPWGGSSTISVRILLVTSSWPEGGSPCCELDMTKELRCMQPNGCADEALTTLTAVSGIGASDPLGVGCTYTCTATAVPNPGFVFVGFQWYQGGVAMGGLTTVNTYMFGMPSTTMTSVTVVYYFVDSSSGDTCTFSRTLTFDCNNGSSWWAKPGAENDKGDVNAPLNNTISIYPNPTTGTVKVTSHSDGIKTIQVIDVNGKKVGNYSYEQTKVAEVSLSGLAPGSYLIKVNDKTSKVVVKTE